VKNHAAYLKYVLRHKWFVFLACLKLKVPLTHAIFHDWTKFLPSEWWSYVNAFYNSDGSKKYDPIPMKSGWNNHQKRNRHHWQYWLLTWDKGNVEALEMPDQYVREMIADWLGASKAITGAWDLSGWLSKNGQNIIVHTYTEELISRYLWTYCTPSDYTAFTESRLKAKP
jgi:Family of unknown function (DUF5662)